MENAATDMPGGEGDSGGDVRRNFIGGLWHGAFLALGMALTQPTTVVAAFISDLTGSTVWVGGLSTVLTVAGALPQLFLARWIEPRPRKMPYLMLAIYLRVVSWGVLAWMIMAIGSEHPQLLTWALVGLLAVFSIGGGLGGVPYPDIIGKVIPPDRRGAFFGDRQIIAGPLAIGAAMLARHVLVHMAYPDNYALLFGLAAGSLLIASLGFWMIREPPQPSAKNRPQEWRALWPAALGGGPPPKGARGGTDTHRVQPDGDAVLRRLCASGARRARRGGRLVHPSWGAGRGAGEPPLGPPSRSTGQLADADGLCHRLGIDTIAGHRPGRFRFGEHLARHLSRGGDGQRPEPGLFQRVAGACPRR